MAKFEASQAEKNPLTGGAMREVLLRLRFVLIALLVYRIGTHIPVPGIDPQKLAELFQATEGTIVDLLNIFSGGALERMSILALNIIPYISASIIMQLVTAIYAPLKKLRNEGESGRRTITQMTRVGTVLLALFQAMAISAGLESQGLAINPDLTFHVIVVVSLVTGTMFMVWLGEQITERGIGNGISLLIFTSIVAGLPAAVGQSFELARQGELNVVALLGILLLSLATIVFIVYVERAQRRLKVEYPRRMTNRGQLQGQDSHLPLKLNMAGVIPAIFASSMLLFPASITSWFGQTGGPEWLEIVSLALQPPSAAYTLIFAGLIIFFCFFYTSLVFNPTEIAENLKKGGGYFPGVRPGVKSAEFIDRVVTRLTVFGSIYIALVCLLPLLVTSFAGVSFSLGGTSMLIVVVVAMDFMVQLQSHLMSHQYESIMKKANLKKIGKTGTVRKR